VKRGGGKWRERMTCGVLKEFLVSKEMKEGKEGGRVFERNTIKVFHPESPTEGIIGKKESQRI